MASRLPVASVAKNSMTTRSLSLLACISAAFRGVDFAQRLARDACRIDSCRHTTVDGDLQQYRADLIASGAVGERTFDVQLQLVGAIQETEHRDVDQTAVAVGKRRIA